MNVAPLLSAFCSSYWIALLSSSDQHSFFSLFVLLCFTWFKDISEHCPRYLVMILVHGLFHLWLEFCWSIVGWSWFPFVECLHTGVVVVSLGVIPCFSIDFHSKFAFKVFPICIVGWFPLPSLHVQWLLSTVHQGCLACPWLKLSNAHEAVLSKSL